MNKKDDLQDAVDALKRKDYKTAYKLTLPLAEQGNADAQKNFKVCQSQSTFTKIKRELVQYGFLDPLDGGGLNAPAIFKISNRWNRYGNEDFKELKYKPGFGSKYFKEAMANPEKRQRIIQSRHGVS